MKSFWEFVTWAIAGLIVATVLLQGTTPKTEQETCIYTDPCTGQRKSVPCEWIIDMPDTCEDIQAVKGE